MTLIVCLDTCLGMTFNGRRQSRDGAVLEDVLKMPRGRLLIAPFSEKYFAGVECTVADDPIAEAVDDDVYFHETGALSGRIGGFDRLIIYRWNEEYPADEKFDVSLDKEGYQLTGRIEFVGRAHKKITKEIYRR